MGKIKSFVSKFLTAFGEAVVWFFLVFSIIYTGVYIYKTVHEHKQNSNPEYCTNSGTCDTSKGKYVCHKRQIPDANRYRCEVGEFVKSVLFFYIIEFFVFVLLFLFFPMMIINSNTSALSNLGTITFAFGYIFLFCLIAYRYIMQRK